jgi:ABC-type multidrug transport system ATPase subunit
LNYTLTAVAVSLGIVLFFQRILIYQGLAEVYNAKMRWLWLWIFPFTRFIPAILWGWRDQWQPSWQVEDLHREMTRFAEGENLAVMDEGLTVNLKERTAREFFRKTSLLRDIHLYIPQGHMVLLLGGSGAGKTTLVNAINGYEKANAQVMLDGRDIYKQYKSMQYETAFVPQQELVRDKDTVYSTLADSAKMQLPIDVSSDLRKKRVNEVIDMFGLTSLKDSLVQKLSGGQKKRLSIAMELLSNPSLFILDEPDSGLDGVIARELFQRLREVADSGRIVIAITHTPDRVVDMFDKVIVLARDSGRVGRLAFYGTPDEARTFFGKQTMEEIVRSVNRTSEGGEGRADEFVSRFALERTDSVTMKEAGKEGSADEQQTAV